MDTKKYDDASWHYEGDYPENLPVKNAATHIGMFLAWCINNNLISDEQIEESGSDIGEVKDRTITGAEFLINNCDEKLLNEDLNKMGNKFAAAYYEYAKQTKFGKAYNNYVNDYSRVLNGGSEDDVYSVEDNWENYDRLSPVIDQRFREWQEFVAKK